MNVSSILFYFKCGKLLKPPKTKSQPPSPLNKRAKVSMTNLSVELLRPTCNDDHEDVSMQTDDHFSGNQKLK